MPIDERRTVLLSPEVERFFAENEIDLIEIIRKAEPKIEIALTQSHVEHSADRKDAALIIMASAALIASVTPIIKEIIRNISKRDVQIREKRLIPIEDSKGNIIRDASGDPILQWVDTAKGILPDQQPSEIHIRGLGIEISFGAKK